MKFLLLAAAIAALPTSIAAATLGGGEWFIDRDPGFGQGTPISTPAAATASLAVTVPAERLDALDPGVHLLGVRLRESGGEWGHVVWRSFVKDAAPESVEPDGAEWFVDEDPGGGNGGTIAIADGKGSALVPTAAMAEGVHLLGTRARDSAGRWGSTVWRPFHVEGPRLAAVEYEIVRAGDVVFQDTVTNGLRGIDLTFALDHGHEGLKLGENHLLRAIPVAADGRKGEPVEWRFDYLRYADAWLVRHFNAAERDDTSVSGWLADPDDDGWNNFREMSFALDPRNADDVPAASVALDGARQLSFRVPAGGTVGDDGVYRVSDLSFRLMESGDLSEWKDVPGAAILSWSVETIAGDRETARLAVRIAENAEPRRFFVLTAIRG